MAELLGIFIGVALFTSPIWLGVWLFVRWRNKKAIKQSKEITSNKPVKKDDKTINQSFIKGGTRFEFPTGSVIDLKTDEFEGTENLIFYRFGPYVMDKYMFFSENNENFNIGFRVENKKILLTYGCLQKEVKLNKGDKVVFLFEDNSKEEFLIEEKAYKVDKDEQGVWVESYSVITDEELKKFAELGIFKWRLYYSAKIPLTGLVDKPESFQDAAFSFWYSLKNFCQKREFKSEAEYNETKSLEF
mgnify:CR=1 FL=1|tara:strand:- start:205 stop:939 length:735 start_codon:yes stop_codon:yes gene_type:complete